MSNRINIGDLILAIARTPRALRRRAEERRHRKLMRTATRYALADMPENTFGKVVGIVRPERKRLLEAPLSGRLCVYYELEIDSMSGESMLRLLASEQEGIAFVLEDGNTRALVDPTNAFMSTAIDHVTRSDLRVMSAREEAIVRRHRLGGKRVHFADGLRFRETIIAADECIAVFGGGVRQPDPDGASARATPAGIGAPSEAGAYRESMPTRICFSGTSRFPLFISDDARAR